MGLKSSPYASTRAMALALEVIKGDRHDPVNVFRWERAVLNLPGSSDYDPSKAWVRRIRDDGTLAADVKVYVDDLRPTGPTALECWKAAQQLSSRAAFLGLQDASRKRRPPSLEPGL